jgi:SAM-dependent methyltransferase
LAEDLRTHYQGLFRRYGNDHRAVQHADRVSQLKRFELLAGILPPEPFSVIDVGCGLGHFHDFLADRKLEFDYLGVDIVHEFIEEAERAHAGVPNARFRVLDVRAEELPRGYDYGVVCGVFNNRMDDNDRFMRDVLVKLFAATAKGIAFNAISTYVDYQDDELYYANPLEVFDFCKRRLSRKVTLRHDYVTKEGSIPYEYTVYVYK